MATFPSSASGSSQTSPSLLAGVSGRDPAAWQMLVNIYGPLVLFWIRRQGISSHDAVDVAQDVFLAVATSISRFRREPGGSFRGWLWVITRNHVARYFRSRADHVAAVGGSAAWHRLAELAEELSDDPAEHTEQTPANEILQRALNLVRSEFELRSWQIFWKSAVDQVSTADVAREFGVTANSVRQTKSRILRRLRQVLGEES